MIWSFVGVTIVVVVAAGFVVVIELEQSVDDILSDHISDVYICMCN